MCLLYMKDKLIEKLVLKKTGHFKEGDNYIYTHTHSSKNGNSSKVVKIHRHCDEHLSAYFMILKL